MMKFGSYSCRVWILLLLLLAAMSFIYALLMSSASLELSSSSHSSPLLVHSLLRQAHPLPSIALHQRTVHQTTSNLHTKKDEQVKSLGEVDTGIDDSITAVVECVTSQGNLTIDVRSNWSPLGAERYLQLVNLSLFTDLPFFRVCPRYITQFGVKHWKDDELSQLKMLRKLWHTPLPDDPSMWGKRDMSFGHVFFAGSGTNSRTSQMVIALCPDVERCRMTGLGKAPWETPIGTLRSEGFQVLRAIEVSGKPYPRLEMAGQHEHAAGPDQSRIYRDQNYLLKEYPNMEYWRSCKIAHQGAEYSRPLDGRVNEHGSFSSNLDVKNTTHPFQVEFLLHTDSSTTKAVTIEVHPLWAPIGAQRFFDLVATDYFTNIKFFRAIKGFMVQFGIHGDPETTKVWSGKRLRDDPVVQSNVRGTLSFATSGPNSRSNQLFINLADNKYLDRQGFAPIGRIVTGMEHIDGIYTGYGEGGRGDGSDGKGPNQARLNNEGNRYAEKLFPLLSHIVSTRLLLGNISHQGTKRDKTAQAT